ncbi:MAG: arginase family protein [Candidatus Methanofastidiosia archaeon]
MKDVFTFGVSLDPDEREDVVRRKNSPVERAGLRYPDPYQALASSFSFSSISLGNFPVESWLTPLPSEAELFMCTVENYVAFIDSDGCWEYTTAVKNHMKDSIGDSRSLMIAVDHSLAVASIMHSCEIYGKDNCGLVIFDSHFDGILPSYRCGLIQYDIDTNPNTKFDPNDPFLIGRTESFNADSFLYKIINEKILLPENIVVVGVSDYPSSKTSKIKDERVMCFVDFYHSYEERGVRIIPKEKIGANPRLFDPASIDVDNLHLSIDIDVGSRNAIYGARFIDYKGLSEVEIFALIKKIVQSKKRIVSADISEIDIWKAGKKFFGKTDRTYEIAAKMANMIFADRP